MKKKNIFVTFLLSIAAISMVVTNNLTRKNNLFKDLKAEDKFYQMDINTITQQQDPKILDSYSGVFENDYTKFLYVSHAASPLGDRVLHLKAKDDNTPAVLCNITVFNGLFSVNVEFSGGPLYAIATSSFYERYNYVPADELVSGVEKTFSGDNLGYILILSPSDQDVQTTNLTVKYHCSHEVDQHFFYEPGSNRVTGARSLGVNRKMVHDYIEFTTNPTPSNNNYSVGKTNPDQDKVDSWYRWNGVSLRNHSLVDGVPVYTGVPFGTFSSNHFEIITSVIVEPGVFYDEDAWFCAAPWVALDDEDHGRLLHYMQAYIGNDNYDPIGGKNLDYTDTYRGRFYTKYAEGGGGYAWGFVDPEEATVVGDSMTLKEAYEATNLPFFHVRFEVIDNSYAIYINGFKVQYEVDFFFDTYVDQKYTINNFALHGVNYGLKDGTAGTAESKYEPYRLTYINPIVREII